MNGCIWDQEFGNKISQVHRGDIDLNALRLQLVQNIHDQIPLLSDGVNKFLAMKDKMVNKDVKLSNIFALIANQNAMTYGQNGQASEMVKQFNEFESDNRNLFGIVNSITRTGQKYGNAEWVRFDEIAGSLMNYDDNKWDRLQNQAKYIDSTLYDKIFGVVAA
jgi:hypothetical protein